jgi:hypothetical protein
MKSTILIVLLILPITLIAAPKKKIEACIADGGVWVENTCHYVTEYDECTPATQFIDCQGGTTSATGPGICVLGETGNYECDYLYQQSCNNDKDCATALGLEYSAYVCCQTGFISRCLNPMLCR